MSRSNLAYIRHGIWSNPDNMKHLEDALDDLLPGYEVDNQEYTKNPGAFIEGESILFNGIVLGEIILRAFAHKKREVEHIVLIGHSQGGLVCRVAAATICAPQQLTEAIQEKAQYIDKRDREKSLTKLAFLQSDQFGSSLLLDCAEHLKAVVTLATPNAGAMTNGQLSLITKGAKSLLRGAFEFFGQKTLDELTTGRLFRVLQYVRVEKVRYLSISGSFFNRYSFFNHDDLQWLPKVAALAPHLEMPNDGVVEDLSVDLREAPLPCEIANLDQQYIHIRSYTDCLDIRHTNIHSRQEVFDEMKKTFKTWGLA